MCWIFNTSHLPTLARVLEYTAALFVATIKADLVKTALSRCAWRMPAKFKSIPPRAFPGEAIGCREGPLLTDGAPQIGGVAK